MHLVTADFLLVSVKNKKHHRYAALESIATVLESKDKGSSAVNGAMIAVQLHAKVVESKRKRGYDNYMIKKFTVARPRGSANARERVATFRLENHRDLSCTLNDGMRFRKTCSATLCQVQK